MVWIPQQQIWTQQPQYARPINTASKLWRPGMGVWSPRALANPVAVGNPAVSVTPSGIGFDTTVSNYWQASATKVVSGLDVFSLAVAFRTSVATKQGGVTLFGERGATGNDIVKIFIADTGVGAGCVARNTAGTLIYLTHPTVSVKGNDGQFHTIVMTKYSANSWECFYDGESISTDAINLPGSGFTESTPLLIGYDLADVAPVKGILIAVVTPMSTYASADAAEFNRNPWQIFAP